MLIKFLKFYENLLAGLKFHFDGEHLNKI